MYSFEHVFFIAQLCLASFCFSSMTKLLQGETWATPSSILLFEKSLSVQGFSQGLRFCDPLQPGGRLGWCRGRQRVEENACFVLGAGGAG